MGSLQSRQSTTFDYLVGYLIIFLFYLLFFYALEHSHKALHLNIRTKYFTRILAHSMSLEYTRNTLLEGSQRVFH
jgi:hypothetical protein